MKKVEVIWRDIVSDDGWHSQNKVDKFTTAENDTVTMIAYLYEEDENQVVLVDSYFKDRDLYGTIHKIPKGCIISVTDL